MRALPLSRRFALPLLFLSLCALFSASTLRAQTLTFTGTVYSPLGPTKGDPIPNILVFVQDPNAPLPTFSQGITVPTGSQNGCDIQPSLVPASVLGSAHTDPTGSFSFNVTGTLPSTVNVVIQAGKWRRQYPYTTAQIAGFTTGTQVALPAMTMPPSSGTYVDPVASVTTISDLPHIAVVTGSADQIECIFPQIGISTSEITDPTAATPGSINFFYSNGEKITANTPSESQLVSSSATYPTTNYDMVIFGCQSNPDDQYALTDGPALVPYTSDGGRVFLTHYEYIWLKDSFPSIATWRSSEPLSADSAVAQLSTNYNGEPTLAAWMSYIGAFDVSAAKDQFTLTNVREDIQTLNSPAQSWVTLPNESGDPVMQFSFDTPIGASGTPTATVGFTNNQTTFLAGDPSDSILINVTNTSTTATQPGLTLTLSIPSGLNLISLQDSGSGSWTCTQTTQSPVCTLPVALAGGASDAVTFTFSISKNAPLGVQSLIGTLTNGGLNESQQCGRVLYNDYHVEEPQLALLGPNTLFNNGASCPSQTTLSNAQKFLEYSLYNLSNFVTPANTDSIQIQESGVITWSPASPQYYGITLASLENATVNTPGTTTYSFNPNPTTTVSGYPDAGTYAITASFVPTDRTDYLSSQQTSTVQIVPDPTASKITNLLSSIYYGQEIGYDPVQGDAQLSTLVTNSGNSAWDNVPPQAGSFYAAIDGTTVCSGSWPAGVTGGPRCPDSGFLGWNVGMHSLQLIYQGTADFSASQSPAYPVQINPDPTATTLTTSASSIKQGQNLALAAAVADTYTTAAGEVVYYTVPSPVSAAVATAQNSIPVPTGAVQVGQMATTSGAATLQLATLIPGTYNIVACFVAQVNSSGTYNFLDSCSASVSEVILNPITIPSSTATTVTSSSNPSFTGQSVTFTASVGTTGPFTVVPTGTVNFVDGATTIGTGTLAGGVATYTTSTLTAGTHSITVQYPGTTALVGSTSSVLTQVVVDPLTAAGPGFLLVVNPTTVPVLVGSSAVVTVQIIPLTGFQQTVALTCSGLPSEAACSFAQPTIPVGGGTTQLLVSAAGPHACDNATSLSSTGGRGLLPLGMLGLLTLCMARNRRKLQGIALALLLCLAPAAISGCGTGNCTDFAVKPGDYSFTVTATPNTGASPVNGSGGLCGGTGTPQSQCYTTVKTQAMTMHVHL